MMKRLTLPLDKEEILSLNAGDSVLLSGTVYTARDCAHKRIFELLDANMPLPFPLKDAFIYYAGPCPAPEGKACGSCGPTTSARMNSFAPRLLHLGLGGMIGKGEMSDDVVDAIAKNGAVYFAAIGGAGAIYGNAVQSTECVAFPDLLSEAVHKMTVKDFPLVVAIDANGKSIYQK
ncbi:MAG: fumarate hydratase C-terminal domain-containing protein [Clostridia bacterium]|nr:fumarate hydratase C-terminal domain-containing protein [Clostridia bacterium]